MYLRCQCILWYKFENDEVEGICLVLVLFCVTVLAYIFYIWRIAKRRTSPVLLSACKARPYTPPDQIACLVVFCKLKAIQDLCIFLLFDKYRYIPICMTIQYMSRQNTLYFIILELAGLLLGITQCAPWVTKFQHYLTFISINFCKQTPVKSVVIFF